MRILLHVAALVLLICLTACSTGSSRLGKTVEPVSDPVGYRERGLAAWYGPDFHGRTTANGEIFDSRALTTAHPSLPFNSIVEVYNETNGRSLRLRVNDRGPYHSGRIVDVSERAAELLDFKQEGVVPVRVRYLYQLQPLQVSAPNVRTIATYR